MTPPTKNDDCTTIHSNRERACQSVNFLRAERNQTNRLYQLENVPRSTTRDGLNLDPLTRSCRLHSWRCALPKDNAGLMHTDHQVESHREFTQSVACLACCRYYSKGACRQRLVFADEELQRFLAPSTDTSGTKNVSFLYRQAPKRWLVIPFWKQALVVVARFNTVLQPGLTFQNSPVFRRGLIKKRTHYDETPKSSILCKMSDQH